jgi:hypothetical protein
MFFGFFGFLGLFGVLLYARIMSSKSPAVPKTSLVPVGLFVGAYLLVASAFALMTRNWEFVVYIVVVLLAGAVVYGMHKKVGFSKGVLWGLALWGLLHMIGGLMPVPESWPVSGDKRVFYSLWLIPGYLKYDMLIHAFGFGIATWASWQGIGTLLAKRLPTVGALAMCVLAGMGLGALNEIVEFVTSLLVPETNVGGYVNTGWDLISNFTGAMIAAVIIGFRRS